MANRSFFTISAFLITILVFSSCGDKKEDSANPVKARFEASAYDVSVGESILFTNLSENASYYQWAFGDGSFDVEENPEHAYASSGLYDVMLVAIGESGSDTAYTSIRVTGQDSNSDNFTIFEGAGITEISLGTSWGSALSNLGTDTLHYKEYSSVYELYLHSIYYPADGIVLNFITPSESLSSSDPLLILYIVYPYAGTTSKGIGIGSTIDQALAAYGTPEDTYEESYYTGYAYDTQGIDFYMYEESGFVEEIDIYPPLEILKRTNYDLDALRLMTEKIRMRDRFR